MNEEQYEKLGLLIDRLESLGFSINMPISNDIHVQCMRNALPEITVGLRTLYESFPDPTIED